MWWEQRFISIAANEVPQLMPVVNSDIFDWRAEFERNHSSTIRTYLIKMGTNSTINLHWLPIYWSQNSIYVLRTNKLLRTLLMFINVNTTSTHTHSGATFDLQPIEWCHIWEGRTHRTTETSVCQTYVRKEQYHIHFMLSFSAGHVVRVSFTSFMGRLCVRQIVGAKHSLFCCCWFGAQIRKVFIHAINVTIFRMLRTIFVSHHTLWSGFLSDAILINK